MNTTMVLLRHFSMIILLFNIAQQSVLSSFDLSPSKIFPVNSWKHFRILSDETSQNPEENEDSDNDDNDTNHYTEDVNEAEELTTIIPISHEKQTKAPLIKKVKTQYEMVKLWDILRWKLHGSSYPIGIVPRTIFRSSDSKRRVKRNDIITSSKTAVTTILDSFDINLMNGTFEEQYTLFDELLEDLSLLPLCNISYKWDMTFRGRQVQVVVSTMKWRRARDVVPVQAKGSNSEKLSVYFISGHDSHLMNSSCITIIHFAGERLNTENVNDFVHTGGIWGIVNEVTLSNHSRTWNDNSSVAVLLNFQLKYKMSAGYTSGPKTLNIQCQRWDDMTKQWTSNDCHGASLAMPTRTRTQIQCLCKYARFFRLAIKSSNGTVSTSTMANTFQSDVTLVSFRINATFSPIVENHASLFESFLMEQMEKEFNVTSSTIATVSVDFKKDFTIVYIKMTNSSGYLEDFIQRMNESLSQRNVTFVGLDLKPLDVPRQFLVEVEDGTVSNFTFALIIGLVMGIVGIAVAITSCQKYRREKEDTVRPIKMNVSNTSDHSLDHHHNRHDSPKSYQSFDGSVTTVSPVRSPENSNLYNGYPMGSISTISERIHSAPSAPGMVDDDDLDNELFSLPPLGEMQSSMEAPLKKMISSVLSTNTNDAFERKYATTVKI